MLWFAGAGIAQHVFDEIQRLAVETCGERILFLTGFGSTETAPFALARTWATDNAANMGLPAAGMELKLVPFEGKLEARVRGPNITPGYWRQPEFTAQAFDEEGFYRLGDTFKFADPDDPKQGLLFDGRIAEDFKLSTGTWVSVGPLRARVHRRLRALRARRRLRRPRPRRHRRAGVSRRRGLPQARAAQAGRCAGGRDRRAARGARSISPRC